MSSIFKTQDMVEDINDMHSKFGVSNWVRDHYDQNDMETLRAFLAFRLDFLEEELTETVRAFAKKDADGIVDGLIDLMVIAIGTLDAFNCDTRAAWKEVHEQNMKKEKGIKESRPNPLGLPDMIKPKHWQDPSHMNHTGILDKVLLQK